ncbi:hypothetical protein [Agromyces sp. NPDC055658]
MRDSKRADRRRAKEAIAAVRELEDEVRGMAKRLPGDARARRRLESAVEFAEAAALAADAERRRSPRFAAERAALAAARLDRASIRYGAAPASTGRAGDVPPVGADAALRARRRAKLVKRRRTQAEQARKMAARAAALTIAQSIVVPKGRTGRAR